MACGEGYRVMADKNGKIVSELKDILVKSDDPVNHPSHYTDGKIEVIEFIEDKKLGFHLGNAVKYISRAGKKDPTKQIEDLKKAIWYIDRYISVLENVEKMTNILDKLKKPDPRLDCDLAGF